MPWIARVLLPLVGLATAPAAIAAETLYLLGPGLPGRRAWPLLRSGGPPAPDPGARAPARAARWAVGGERDAPFGQYLPLGAETEAVAGK